MGDRAYIGRKTRQGYEYVYIHWGGSRAGKILSKYYKSPKTVKKLISMGAISSLKKKIGKKHSFNNRPDDVSTFYHRDRGDPKMISKAKNLNDFIHEMENVYVYIKGKWKRF